MNRTAGVGLAVTLLAFLIYLPTVCPTIFAGDAGELATAAATLGIAHPPGYPLWTLMGRVAIVALPGEPAHALNLFSALAMAGAAGLVAALLSVWTGGVLVPAGMALAFAVSRGVWTSAVTTEVYALNLLLTVGALLAAVLARRRGPLLCALSAYLIGLGVANHPFVLLVGLPVLLLALAANERRPDETPGARVGRLPWMAGAFALGLTVYAYLPLRLSAGPEVNWAGLRSLADIFDHVLRAQYGGLGEASADASFGVRLRVFLAVLSDSFALPLWIVAAIGAIALLRGAHPRRGMLLLLFFVLAGPVTAAAIRYEDTFLDHSVVTVFFLPAVLAAFLLAGIGLAEVARFASERFGEQQAAARLVAGGLALLPVVVLWEANRETCDRSRSTFAADYARTVLRELPPNARLFTRGDNACFSLHYATHVLGLRPDVTLLDRTLNLDVASYGEDFPSMSRVERRDTRAARENDFIFGDLARPVFFTEDTDAMMFAGCRTVPSGYVAQLLRPGERAAEVTHPYVEALPPVATDDFMEVHFVSVSLYREALWFAHQGEIGNAQRRLGTAAELAERVPAILRNIGLARLELQDLDEAERLFVRTIEMEPENEDALYNLAVLCSQTGRTPEALEWFERLSRLETTYPEVPMGYAVELLKAGRVEEAAAQAAKALQLAPELEAARKLAAALRRGAAIGGEAGVLEARRELGPLTSDGTLQLAARYLERGNVERATELYREAVARSPDSVLAAYGLGYGLLQAGRYADAEGAFRTVLSLDPESADGRNALAFILAQTGDSLEVAERLAREALELDPSRAAYWNDTLGWIRFRRGALDDALEVLRLAEGELPPDDFATRSENLYHQGAVLAALDRTEEARDHFGRSARLSADGPWTVDREARMRELGMDGDS